VLLYRLEREREREREELYELTGLAKRVCDEFPLSIQFPEQLRERLTVAGVQ